MLLWFNLFERRKLTQLVYPAAKLEQSPGHTSRRCGPGCLWVPDSTQMASARQEMEKPSQRASSQPGSAMYPRQDLLQALLSEKQAHENVDASSTWTYRQEGLSSAKAGPPKCFGRGGGKGTGKGHSPCPRGFHSSAIFQTIAYMQNR